MLGTGEYDAVINRYSLAEWKATENTHSCNPASTEEVPADDVDSWVDAFCIRFDLSWAFELHSWGSDEIELSWCDGSGLIAFLIALTWDGLKDGFWLSISSNLRPRWVPWSVMVNLEEEWPNHQNVHLCEYEISLLPPTRVGPLRHSIKPANGFHANDQQIPIGIPSLVTP